MSMFLPKNGNTSSLHVSKVPSLFRWKMVAACFYSTNSTNGQHGMLQKCACLDCSSLVGKAMEEYGEKSFTDGRGQSQIMIVEKALHFQGKK